MSAKILSNFQNLFRDRFYENDFAGFLVESPVNELYCTISKGKKCVVFADANIFSGTKLGASLTDDDVSSNYFLTTKDLNTQAFAM